MSHLKGLSAEEVLAVVLRQSEEPLETIQRMSGFLIDPSAGYLTAHQKEVAYQIYQSAGQLEELLLALRAYQEEQRL